MARKEDSHYGGPTFKKKKQKKTKNNTEQVWTVVSNDSFEVPLILMNSWPSKVAELAWKRDKMSGSALNIGSEVNGGSENTP